MAILGVGKVAVEAAVAPGDGLVGEHDSCDSFHDSWVTAYLGMMPGWSGAPIMLYDLPEPV